MFDRLSVKAVSYLIDNNKVLPENKEEYEYGLSLFFSTTLNVVTLVMIGLLTKMFFECMLFFVIYKVLRKYIGGYHANSMVSCYIQSFIVYFIALGGIKFLVLPSRVWLIFTFLCSVMLFICAPVESLNKPLDEIEQKVFGKRARIEITVLLGLFFIIYFTGFLYVAKIISCTIFIVTALAVLGRFKWYTAHHLKKVSLQA